MKKHTNHWLPRLIKVNAITFGNHVFFVMKNPSSRLISHEKKHVEQYEQDGFIKFLLRYFYEYLENRMKGMKHHQSYLAVSYEVEAREAELKDKRGVISGLNDRIFR